MLSRRLHHLRPVAVVPESVRYALTHWFRCIERMVLHLEIGLLGSKVSLVILLGLYCPRHVNITSVLANVGISNKLRVQPLRTHVLFDTVNDFDDVLDVFFELLSNLKTIH